jgi:hypothetical protein
MQCSYSPTTYSLSIECAVSALHLLLKKYVPSHTSIWQCEHCCVYKVPLGSWINTVAQEINLQCETEAVCVWLSVVLELLKLDLNPHVKIKLCKINCLKLQACAVTCTSTMYIQNLEQTKQILYIHVCTCLHIICVCVHLHMETKHDKDGHTWNKWNKTTVQNSKTH